MTPPDESDTFDRAFQRLGNAEGYLRTVRHDLLRLGLPDCAGAIRGCIGTIGEVSDALVACEKARLDISDSDLPQPPTTTETDS